MSDAEPCWVAQVQQLLEQANGLHSSHKHKESLPTIEAALARLEEEDARADWPGLHAEALRLWVHATCRRATAEDLAAGDRRLAQAFDLISQRGAAGVPEFVLRGRLWNTQGVLHHYNGKEKRYHNAVAAYDQAIALRQALDLDWPEFRNDLANSWNNKGAALHALGDPASVAVAIAAYDQAIALRQALDLDRPESRNDLANSWNNKGIALQALGDPVSLKAAAAAYDEAIGLQQASDLDRPECRNDLANSWTNKGNTLQALGDPASLATAVAAYDEAIALRQALDLDRPEFRDELAKSWNNKGTALQAFGDPVSLAAAIVAYDEAIGLQQVLDLDRPEFRNYLANSWTNKGNTLQALGDPVSLAAAVAAYNEAIALRQALDLDRPEFRNYLANSWTNKGNTLQALGDPVSLAAAVAAYDEAIALRQALDLDRSEFRNDLARSWNNKSTALQAFGDPVSLAAAVVACDEAIALQQALNLDQPEFRNDLAAIWGNKGGALRALGDPASLTTAVTACDEAIALRQTLDLERPEFRNDLANSWTNKGSLLQVLGDPASLTTAVAACDEAIALRQTLDLDRPEFRNDLARSWIDKGNALQALGDPGSLVAAVGAYDHAIALQQVLDLDRPEFRSALAGSWANKGSVLQTLGDPASLAAAVAAFDQAIALRQTLDLCQPEFLNDLAACWNNKGNSLQALGDSGSTVAAVVAYDKAIALWQARELDRPEFRNCLANSWTNKGRVLQALSDPVSVVAAVAAYDEAITLRQALDLDRPEFRNGLAEVVTHKAALLANIASEASSLADAEALLEQAVQLRQPLLTVPRPFYLPAVRGSAFTLSRLADVQRILRGPAAATDPLDDGLALLRQMEQFGLQDQRPNRAILFRMALNFYRRAGQQQFLPELIAETLEPAQPGSAADSATMQEDAAAELTAAIRDVATQPERAGILSELLVAQRRLRDLRTRQLAGSARLALINADIEAAAGRPAEALRILDRQIAYRPTDPEGYWVRARFQQLRGHYDAARQDLMQAACHAIALADDPAAHAAGIARFAAALLHLRLTEVAEAHRHSPGREALLARFDALRDWLLYDLPQRLLQSRQWPDPERRTEWGAALSEHFNHHWDAVAELRGSLLQAQDHARAEAICRNVRHELASTIELCRGALVALPQFWRDFADEILAAMQIAMTDIADLPEAQRDEKGASEIEAALKRASSKIKPSELTCETVRLAESLGPIWTSLLHQEQRYLAIALRCRDDQVMHKFLPLELGCAVEFALLERLLTPLQIAHLRDGQPLPESTSPDDWLGKQVSSFVTGKRPSLEMAALVGMFGRVTTRLAEADESDLFGLLATRLGRQPGRATLRAVDLAAWKHRIALLDRLKDRRNKAAHAPTVSTQTQAETDDMTLWHGLVEDPQHAFFRYFPLAFTPPAEARSYRITQPSKTSSEN